MLVGSCECWRVALRRQRSARTMCAATTLSPRAVRPHARMLASRARAPPAVPRLAPLPWPHEPWLQTTAPPLNYGSLSATRKHGRASSSRLSISRFLGPRVIPDCTLYDLPVLIISIYVIRLRYARSRRRAASHTSILFLETHTGFECYRPRWKSIDPPSGFWP